MPRSSSTLFKYSDCFYCGNPGTQLCDGKTESGTCDRPMCVGCVAKSGAYIACVRGKGRKSYRGTIDYCRDCAGITLSDRVEAIVERVSLPACTRCSDPVAIPGLDANFCRKCGWVVSLGWLAQAQPAKSKRRKEVAS